MKQGKNSSPYQLGLLCLVPLVGAFVGIGLILYGVFKYRDKLLILIGIGGVAITVGVYYFMFYNVTHIGVFDKAMEKTARMQLNNVAKDIERYRILYGRYPASLKELEEDDETVIAVDPFSERGEQGLVNFQYIRKDSTYILFSVGPDGLPDTADDIFSK